MSVGVFTKEEDQAIIKGRELRKSWEEIGNSLGRTANVTKKHYYRHLRNKLDAILNIPVTNGKTRKNDKLGISLADFVANNDQITKIRLAIRKGLSSLKAGMLVKDADFKTECGCNHNSWRHVADEDEFLSYQLTIDNRYWWAKPETIQEALQKVPKARALE